MSWTPEAIIVCGYIVPAEFFAEVDKEIYEDYYINSDPVCGRGEVFFGKIIKTIYEGMPAVALTTKILENEKTKRVKSDVIGAFIKNFTKLYADKDIPLPLCNIYITTRYN